MARPKYTPQRLVSDTACLQRAILGDIARQATGSLGRPSLVVLSGLPGTGKSHFAGELSKRLPFLVVGSDRMRKLLIPRPKYTPAEHLRVFAACHQLIDGLLADGISVVFDAAHLTEWARQPAYELALQLEARLILVWFTAPREVIQRRLDDRAAGLNSDSYSDADWQVYCRLRPGEEPIARPHITVNSAQDISWALDRVVRLVKSN
jgi:hypothetical protein